jgi:hypothetical protein
LEVFLFRLCFPFVADHDRVGDFRLAQVLRVERHHHKLVGVSPHLSKEDVMNQLNYVESSMFESSNFLERMGLSLYDNLTFCNEAPACNPRHVLMGLPN